MENINLTSANGTTHHMDKGELESLLSCVTKIEDVSFNGSRFFYHVGNEFIIEVHLLNGYLGNGKSLMNQWKKHGYIKERLKTYVGTDTYFYCDGKCSGKFNIMNKCGKVDFDYMFECTELNIKYLVAKCIQLMKKGTGLK